MKIGRPPIPAEKMKQLLACFTRGDGPSRAAKECEVHRNTASAYFAEFRHEKRHEQLQYSSPEMQRRESFRALYDRARRDGITTKELTSRIIRVVIKDKLLDRLLGSAIGDGSELLKTIEKAVPRHLPEHMRDDIRQELLMSVLEGETSITDLKSGTAAALRKYRSIHRDQFAPSLDAPIPGTDGLTLIDTISDDAIHA